MGVALKLLSLALGAFELFLKWKKSKQIAESVELTTMEQKAHAKIINSIGKQERVVSDRLRSIDGLRERAEAINKLKNSDV